eukprot:Nk52_evm43s24 gene=Nk52_evmTU43s24
MGSEPGVFMKGGDSVLFQKDGWVKLFELEEEGGGAGKQGEKKEEDQGLNLVKISKGCTVSMRNAIGKPFGSYFEVVPRVGKEGEEEEEKKKRGNNNSNNNNNNDKRNKRRKRQKGDAVNVGGEDEEEKDSSSASSYFELVYLPDYDGFGMENSADPNEEGLEEEEEGEENSPSLLPSQQGPVVVGSEINNSSLISSEDNQQLTAEDIEGLKGKYRGDEIIAKLIENSATFSKKTEFSKQKYIKRKQKKYSQIVKLIQPNIRTMCDFYYMLEPAKILNLRVDSLSQMLNLCNVSWFTNSLVFDQTQGMLTASVVMRTMSNSTQLSLSSSSPSSASVTSQPKQGVVMSIHSGDFPNRFAVDAMNFDKAGLDRTLFHFPIDDCAFVREQKALVTAWKRKQEREAKVGQGKEMEAKEGEEEEDNSPDKVRDRFLQLVGGSILNIDIDPDMEPRKREGLLRRKEKAIRRQECAKVLWEMQQFDALLCAPSMCPDTILLELFPFLRIGRPFVVFCEYKEPLLKSYERLRKTGQAVRLTIHETWMRPYQVLPARTHPFMNMVACSGFILAGIKVAPK